MRDSAGFSPDFAPGAQHRQRYQARNPDIPPPHTQPTAPRRRRTPTSTPPGRSDGLPRETVTAAQDDLRALGRSTADRSAAGPDLTVVLPTGLGQARNNVIVNAADALIAVGGSWGTLSEIALAMRAGRIPVVQIAGWSVHDAAGRPAGGIVHADGPAAAVAATGLWD